MRLSAVHIRNFRCIQDLEIHFDKVTVLIGPNDAGKSTVLRAIDWCLNGSPGDLSNEDVCRYTKEDDPAISVELRFADLDEQDREAIDERLLSDDGKALTLRRTWSHSAEETTCMAMAYEPFEYVRGQQTPDGKKKAYQQFQQTHPDLGLPDAGTAPKVDRSLRDWELAHPGELTRTPVRATELIAKGKLRRRFDYVFVSADLRTRDQLKETRRTILSRLTERIDRSPATEKVLGVMTGAHRSSSTIVEKYLGPQMEEISTRLSNEMAEFRSGHAIKLRPGVLQQEPDIKIEVRVDDGTIDVPIDRQGHGFQRTVMLSALKLLASSAGRQSGGPSVMLALEEPETHQSNVQSRQLAWSLRRATEVGDSDSTVVFATHSPIFVDPLRFEEVRRICRPRADENVSCASRVRTALPDAVFKRVGDYMERDQIEVQLHTLLTEQFAEGFFSEGVVLVEGETDKAVIEEASTETAGPLFKFGVSVINAYGKSNLILAQAILDDLGIPAMTVFDSDRGNADRIRKKGTPKAEEEAVAEENKARRENVNLQRYHRVTARQDFPAGRLGDRLFAWDDNLEQVLRDWTEWDREFERVRKELHDSKWKRPSTYRLATRRCEGELCASLLEIRSMARSLTKV
ncbi:ATP-dependent nuclease [Glycomyces arizonensis]|uniref:ATP-dependent nuclease n=1 Tax=Glycomyces arizonensis TaxID=256035 RepID=UPI0003F92C20|nr:AAA family ATPase [Glycomyces arizonensis]